MISDFDMLPPESGSLSLPRPGGPVDRRVLRSPRFQVSRSTKDAEITLNEGNTACLPLVEIGSEEEGGIGLSVPELEGAGSMSVSTHSRSTVYVDRRGRARLWKSAEERNDGKCESCEPHLVRYRFD